MGNKNTTPSPNNSATVVNPSPSYPPPTVAAPAAAVAMGTAQSHAHAESVAIERMTADLSEGVHSPQEFGNKLQKHGFITQATLSGIMSTTADNDATKITKILGVVSTYIKQSQPQSTRVTRFNTFVYVVMVEMALEDLGQQLIAKCRKLNSKCTTYV